jgi:hypothetical protein
MYHFVFIINKQKMSCWVIISILLILFIGLHGTKVISPLSPYIKQRGDEDSIIYFNVIVMGTLFWPILWHSIIGINIFQYSPIMIIPFMWPIVLGILQLIDVYYDRYEDAHDHQTQRITLVGSIQADTVTVVSFAFAMGTLFWRIDDRQVIVPSVKIVAIALLICVAFIVPTYHAIDNNQKYTTYIRVFQKVLVNYSVGFIMTALIGVLANSWANKDHNTTIFTSQHNDSTTTIPLPKKNSSSPTTVM